MAVQIKGPSEINQRVIASDLPHFSNSGDVLPKPLPAPHGKI
jgi:hypothetical protein